MRRRPSARLVLIILLLSGAVLLGGEVRQGWFPHDEGSLGQSAERVLAGEVPHRDFDEIYTGLLSYIDAAAIALLGPNSVALRIPLFFASLLWLWAMYRILLRFMPPEFAGLGALTAFVWGVPNYPAPLPSWYILFAATGGALALLKWRESGERRWLIVAGAMGGVGFLFKLTGIFFFLGGGLALLATPGAGVAPITPAPEAPERAGSRMPRLIVAVALLLMLAALLQVVGRGDSEILRLFVPTFLIAIATALRLLRSAPGALSWRTLVDRLGPFLVGGAVPVLVFLALFAAAGGLGALLEGVFITPFRRVAFASFSPPPVVSLLFAVPVWLALWLPTAHARARWIASLLATAFFTYIVARSAPGLLNYRLGWLSAWGLLFFVAIDGARLAGARRAAVDAVRRDGALTVACVAVAMALVEYPFAAPIYTLYALPLAIVATAVLVRERARAAVGVQIAVLGFFLVFGSLRILPGAVRTLGIGFLPTMETRRLDLPRSGLYLDSLQVSIYEDLITFVQDTARGRPIWAGPDAPEVYFLSGLPNQTRTLFDFLDTPADMNRPLADRLDANGTQVVVIKVHPPFSLTLTPAGLDSLRRVFPHEHAMLEFLVLWR